MVVNTMKSEPFETLGFCVNSTIYWNVFSSIKFDILCTLPPPSMLIPMRHVNLQNLGDQVLDQNPWMIP